ncbi:FMN-dependent NADH-azoreductase [Variovorax sp. IB41]|uniref:FMN-dependent NADH-azoreductase n=1 Tax=Variovorax sp. IB41 TaxID=2779370 RepID=UPI0018E7BD0E|nr:NAD(P)H-dependent oxidoreductase [Variovorax sp. IB41]MBJ2159965.1 NAD(P)H-dependent oxidoreductase [Variovorax sp. IB41]
MKELLYIEASPRKSRSASIEVARAFIDAAQVRHPGCKVTVRDLWGSPLPELSQDMMDAKYAGIQGLERTAAQRTAWEDIERLAAPFHAADHILLALPLWNFGIPYRLKQFIDLVTHKDVLFRFDANGMSGMLATPKATVVCARGLDYPLGDGGSAHAMDFQKPYIETWLRFIGVKQVDTVVVEKTLLGAEVDTASRAAARQEAVALARAA